MKHKVKVMIDGQEREVEIDINPSELGLMSRDEVAQSFMPKDAFETELARRVAGITKGTVKLETLQKDEKAREEFLTALGYEPIGGDDDHQTIDAQRLAQLQEEWRHKELGPVNERADKAEGRVKTLLNRILWADIVQAAAESRVHDHLLRPVAEGQQAPIVAMLGTLFGYDEETDNHYVRKGDGYEFSSDPQKSGSAYKTVREFVTEWATKKENAPFINVGKPGSPNIGKPGQVGGTATIERPQGRPLTLQEYQAAEKAAGEGGSVVVK